MRKDERVLFTPKSKRVVKKLVSKYSHSVRPCEVEDLEQTVWFLFLIASSLYDPKRGCFEGFAFYFADRKLKDHFWRRVKLPKSEGGFNLLHIKASFADEEKFISQETRKKEEFPDILRMKAEGYTFMEMSQMLGISYSTARRRWKKAILNFRDRS